MKKKYKMSLISILIVLSFLIIIGVGYSTYLKQLDNKIALVEVKSGLSINYLNGNSIKTNEDTYQIDFSVTNMEDEILYYYIKLNTLESDDEVSYKLMSNNSSLNNIEESINKTNIGIRIKIEPGKTHSYNLIFYNPNKQSLTTEVLVDLETIDFNLKNTILNYNEVLPNLSSFDQVSLESEAGLIELTNEEGTSYYYRGNVKNNYVNFADKLWRIVRINPDGTVQLVLDNVLDDNASFSDSEQTNTTDFSSTKIYQVLTQWYEDNLKDYDAFIANSKYCTDDNALSEENGVIHYLAENRLFQNFSPVLTCPGTSNPVKIALLTADDVMLAGGGIVENKNFYLTNEAINRAWWTMTLSKKESGQFYYITVNDSGIMETAGLQTSTYGVRPSITLIKKVNVSGMGTIENPYTLTLM